MNDIKLNIRVASIMYPNEHGWKWDSAEKEVFSCCPQSECNTFNINRKRCCWDMSLFYLEQSMRLKRDMLIECPSVAHLILSSNPGRALAESICAIDDLYAKDEVADVEDLQKVLMCVEQGDFKQAISFLDSIINKLESNDQYVMTIDDWERVANEGFLIIDKQGTISLLQKSDLIMSPSIISSYFEVVREKGLRQPHFQGDKHPEGDVTVSVKCEHDYLPLANASDVDWTLVKEYIVLE